MTNSDSVYGFVPAVGNPLNTENRAHGALVRGGYSALHGEPAVDWSGRDSEQPVTKKRGRPRKAV